MLQIVLPLHLDICCFPFGWRLILFMSKSTPCWLAVVSFCFIRWYTIHLPILSHFTFYLGIDNVSVVNIHWLQKLLPSISLNTKLLFGCPDFASRIGVKITLLKLLYKFLNIGYNFVDERLISAEVGTKGSVWFNADIAIEIVVASFHGLDESDNRFVRRVELPAHLLYDDILF